MLPRILFLLATVLLPLALCQNLFELYKAMITDQATRSKNPPVNIEIFGESLCPDTTRFVCKQSLDIGQFSGTSETISCQFGQLCKHPHSLTSHITLSDWPNANLEKQEFGETLFEEQLDKTKRNLKRRGYRVIEFDRVRTRSSY